MQVATRFTVDAALRILRALRRHPGTDRFQAALKKMRARVGLGPGASLLHRIPTSQSSIVATVAGATYTPNSFRALRLATALVSFAIPLLILFALFLRRRIRLVSGTTVFACLLVDPRFPYSCGFRSGLSQSLHSTLSHVLGRQCLRISIEVSLSTMGLPLRRFTCRSATRA